MKNWQSEQACKFSRLVCIRLDMIRPDFSWEIIKFHVKTTEVYVSAVAGM